jgi:hypothetical protein
MLKTHYEKGGDVTYEAAAAITGGRLLTLSAAGDHAAKPKVVHTSGRTDRAVGAAFQDAVLGDDVGCSHRTDSWQLLEAAGAIAFEADVAPAANGRIQQADASAGEQVYGQALSVAADAGDFIWVRVYGR